MGKFTNTFAAAAKIFGLQIIITLAAIMFMGSFSGFLGSNLSMKIYSSVTALIFISSYYSRIWHVGRMDAKHVKVYNKHNEDKKSLNYYKGLSIGAVAAIPNAIALIVMAYAAITGNGYTMINVFYRIFQCIFIGWLGNDNLTYLPNCIIVTIIPLLFAGPAYFAGTKEFSLAEKYLPKIIYKKKPNKKDSKKNK